MKIGLHLPQWGDWASRNDVLTVARAAEAAGLDSVWVADHVVFPSHSTSRYPYRPDGVPFQPGDGFLEALTTLAVVAGATDHIGLGTSVLVLPMREPLLVAKTVATIDALAPGRVTLAVGAGWWREEFEALGASFEDRGRRFDEQLTILRQAWSAGVFEHHGAHYEFGELACLPRPTREPPVLVGGMTAAAWRRAGQAGSGWHGVGGDLAALKHGWDQTRSAAADAGRDPEALIFSASTGISPDPERAIRRLNGFAELGLHQVVLNTPASTVRELLATIDDLANIVIPRVPASSPMG